MEQLGNTKHELFAQALVKHKGHQTHAYLEVYPSSNYDSARHSASILLRNAYIKQRVGEILEQNGLGLKEVVKKLAEFMNAKSYYHEGNELVLKDNRYLQFQGLTLILRLYDSLIKSGGGMILTSEEVAQIEQLVKEIEALKQKKQENL